MYLVCTPNDGQQQFVDYLNSHQIKSYPLPLMDFDINHENLKVLANKINDFDYVMFISPNAIKFCADIIKEATHPIFLVVGVASARKLKLLTKLPIIYPTKASGASSLFEEKLKHLSLKNKKVLIVKGVGGNQILSKRFNLIDVNWQEIDIYTRNKIHINVPFIKKSLTTKGFQGIIITSSILVEWLFIHAKKHKYFDILVQQPFFTIHDNIAKKLTTYGVNKVFTSAKTDQYSLVNLIKEFVNE